MKMDTVTEILTTTIEQELNCKFITIDPGKEDFHIFRAINEIFRHVKHSPKKNLIKKVSTRLLGLEFKSDSIIKSKVMKFIVKKYYQIISNNRKILCQLQKKIFNFRKLNKID